MELREALTQISEIRLQMARTEVFRGYRAVPVAFSGIVALTAAVYQAVWLADPERHIHAYLALWLGAAAVSTVAAGTEMIMRYWRSGSSLRKEITLLAVEQFLPSIGAGGLLTVVLVMFAPRQRLDAAGIVADPVQPGHLRFVPVAAVRNLLGRSLLHGRRSNEPGSGS